MSTILYDMIHDRATATWIGEAPTAANYELWVAHWFATAQDLANDFNNQNLPKTAAYIEEMIDDQRRFTNHQFSH